MSVVDEYPVSPSRIVNLIFKEVKMKSSVLELGDLVEEFKLSCQTDGKSAAHITNKILHPYSKALILLAFDKSR